MKPKASMGALCGLFGLSRQGWYKMQSSEAAGRMEEELVLELVCEVREDLPRLGTRKLYHILEPKFREHHLFLGRDALFSLLERHRMLVRPKHKYTRTTNSHHWLRVWENLTIGLELSGPGQLWVSDITYIRTDAGFCYLSLVTDAYSRKIIGFHLSHSLNAESCVCALKMALASREGHHKGLIHHSDRGVQYCSNQYVELLKSNGISISMAAKGNPYENAKAERVNGILKSEFSLDATFKGYREALGAVIAAVHAYNHIRPHGSCDNLTPAEAHKGTGPLTKRWKDYPKINPKETVAGQDALGVLAAPQTPGQV